MSGRDKFQKYSRIISIICRAFSIFPRSFLLYLLDFFSTTPGVLGVLIRYVLLTNVVKEIGSNVYIGRFCTFKNTENISIGDNVSIHECCYLDGIGGISIGKDVSIAHNSSLLSFEHRFDNAEVIKYQPLMLSPIYISDDVWIGCGVRVLSGVSVATRTVIGANSLVNTDTHGGVYVGTPAKRVREI